MTDTTDLLPGSSDEAAATEQAPAAPRTRRRATSGGTPSTPSPPVASAAPRGGLSSLLLPELQSLASDLGITGTAKLRKSALIEAITAHQNGGAKAAPAAPAPSEAVVEQPPVVDSAELNDDDSDHRNHGDLEASHSGHGNEGSDFSSEERGDDRTDQEREQDSADDSADGGRPTRVDRGRERFLEREARRQERVATLVAEGMTQDEATAAVAAERPQRDRTPGQAAAPRRDAQATQTPRQNDRQQPDRPVDRLPAPQNAPLDDDEFGEGRRGRFRERGRGRGRGTRDRFPGDVNDAIISDDDVLLPIAGILDILENYAFVRTTGYLTGPNDVYVSLQQVRKYDLRRGDAVTGAVRQQRDGEQKAKYNALVRLDTINGLDPEESKKRPDFTKLTPLYPQERLRLETDSNILTTRVIDLVMPVGKGQRALIVSPPKAGKTMVMQAIANAITTNNPECHLMVVLVDERPEEVTDMQRSVKGEVIASTFDRPPQDHITVAELSIERAKRLVELGADVVVLLDSITRLGRAYNLGAPASGRILTGGVDSAALYPPKRFLGAARNIENGGSLTIFATALVETGSAMDTVIFEEFKGTGNAELKLDRRLADKRIFPAIDVDASGTRKEELLLAPQELRITLQLRRVLHALDTSASLELLLDKMKATRNNVEFLMQIQKTTVEQPDV